MDSKIDYKSAYRRRHLNAEAAVQTCTQLLLEENLTIIALRLTFGGSPCPYEWGVMSESICDLSMALLHSNEWDPSSLKSKLGDLVPQPKILLDNEHFAEGKDLIVDTSIDPRGTSDVYIYDTISLCVDIEGTDNAERLTSTKRNQSLEQKWQKRKNTSRGWSRRNKSNIGMTFQFQNVDSLPTRK